MDAGGSARGRCDWQKVSFQAFSATHGVILSVRLYPSWIPDATLYIIRVIPYVLNLLQDLSRVQSREINDVTSIFLALNIADKGKKKNGSRPCN